jgi:hypothetical protein
MTDFCRLIEPAAALRTGSDCTTELRSLWPTAMMFLKRGCFRAPH